MQTKKRLNLKSIAKIIYFIFLFVPSVQANAQFFIMPSDMTIPINGKIPKIVVLKMTGTGTDLLPSEVMMASFMQWTVNGISISNQNPAYGSLNEDLSMSTASYTAPSKVPDRNPVAIAVTFKTDNATKEQQTLICNVTIEDDSNKVILNGSPYFDKMTFLMASEQNQRAAFSAAMSSTAAQSAMQSLTPQQKEMMQEHMLSITEDTTNIKATYYTEANTFDISGISPGEKDHLKLAIELNLFLPNPDTGTFSFSVTGKGRPSPGVQLVTPQYPAPAHAVSLASVDADCGTCSPHTLPGSITITKCDGPGGHVKGYYNGLLMGVDPGDPEHKIYVNISGQFDAIRMKDQ